MSKARPIVSQSNHLGMTGAVYLPVQKCYLMIGWYYPKGGGKMPDAHSETVEDVLLAHLADATEALLVSAVIPTGDDVVGAWWRARADVVENQLGALE